MIPKVSFTRVCGAAAAVAFLFFPAGGRAAQPGRAATWSASLEPDRLAPGASALLQLDVDLDPGWHTYSLTQPAGGPVPTRVELLEGDPVEKIGAVTQSKFSSEMDAVFHVKVESFSDHARFTIPVRVRASAKPGDAQARAQVTFQMCNGQVCLPPTTQVLHADFVVAAAKEASSMGAPAAPPQRRTSDATAPAPAPAASVKCPDASESIGSFHQRLRELRWPDWDTYSRLASCVPKFLETRKPQGEDLYDAALLWVRYDNVEHNDASNTAKIVGLLESYRKLPEPRRHEEGALEQLVVSLCDAKRFDEAVDLYDRLLDTYRRHATSEELWGDTNTIEFAGSHLIHALGEARRYELLQAVAPKNIQYLQEQTSQLLSIAAGDTSWLVQSYEDEGKREKADEARKAYAKPFDSKERDVADVDFWITHRRVEALEKKDPAAALAELRKGKSFYEKMGIARLYDIDETRLKLSNAPVPPLDAKEWLNSRPLPFGQLRGKVVLLDFWMTWCMPCRHDFPNLLKLAHGRAKDGLVVIGVTQNDGWVMTADGKSLGRGKDAKLGFDQEVAQLRQFVKDFGLTIPSSRRSESDRSEGTPTRTPRVPQFRYQRVSQDRPHRPQGDRPLRRAPGGRRIRGGDRPGLERSLELGPRPGVAARKGCMP